MGLIKLTKWMEVYSRNLKEKIFKKNISTSQVYLNNNKR